MREKRNEEGRNLRNKVKRYMRNKEEWNRKLIRKKKM